MVHNAVARVARKGRMDEVVVDTVSARVSRRERQILPRLALVSLVLFGVFDGGCGQPQPESTSPAQPIAAAETKETVEQPPVVMPTGFGPARVHILPLTELMAASREGAGPTLYIYLALLDGFDAQIKAPTRVRFEFYEFVPRSAEPKGQRLDMWHVDLTSPAVNNTYWRDFLRAYEVERPVQANPDETYVLEATCMCPDDKRLTTEFVLKPGR